MQYHDLNIYVLLEILHQYAIITNDGPFTLTLVCTLWRDLVLSTPLLWSYITIKESFPNYRAKIDRAFTLSGDFPLTVALALPLSTLKPFKDCLLRASSLHIHIDDIIEAKVPPGHILDGDKAVEMMITLLKETDIRYKGPVTWYYSQAPISLSTSRVHDYVNLGKGRDSTEGMDVYFRSPYPVFHTLFSTRGSQIYDMARVFRHLKTMINLSALHLSCDALTYDYRSASIIVTFPRLSELRLSDPTRSGLSSRDPISLQDLVEWISAPALEYLRITAPVYSTLHILHSIYQRSHPSTLSLDIRPQAKPYKREPVCNGVGSLHRIDVTMCDEITANVQVLNQLEEDILQRISPSAICNIIINSGPELPPNVFQRLRCPLNVTYKGLYPQEGFSNSTQYTMDTLTFCTSETPSKTTSIPRCRKLSYIPYTTLNLIHHPNSWPPDLEELDSGNSEFRSALLSSAGSTSDGSTFSFSHLTAVTCTPAVASVLIYRGLTSILRVLTLVSTREVGLDQSSFNVLARTLQKRLSNDHIFGSNLSQLNIQFFPPWFSHITLLHLLVQRRGQAVLSVELPGLPHKSILRSLVSVLSGAPPVTNEAVYRQLVPEAYWSSPSALPLNCRNCYNSGFKCYVLSKKTTCKCFIDGRKVSVTKNTILV